MTRDDWEVESILSIQKIDLNFYGWILLDNNIKRFVILFLSMCTCDRTVDRIQNLLGWSLAMMTLMTMMHHQHCYLKQENEQWNRGNRRKRRKWWATLSLFIEVCILTVLKSQALDLFTFNYPKRFNASYLDRHKVWSVLTIALNNHYSDEPLMLGKDMIMIIFNNR